MDTLIRVGRAVLLLVLAVVAVSLVIAIASPGTGRAEKAVLGLFLVATAGSATRIAVIAAGLRGRLPRH